MGIVVPLAVLAPLAIAIPKRHSWGPAEKWIAAYLVNSALFNVLAKILAIYKVNNLPFLHLYTLLEFLIITSFFRVIAEPPRIRRLVRWLQAGFSVFAIGYVCTYGNLFAFNMLPRSVAALIIILFCLYFLIDYFSGTGNKYLSFSFITLIGLLVYFSGSICLFALAGFKPNSRLLDNIAWNLHATYLLVMYLIFAYAYYQSGKS